MSKREKRLLKQIAGLTKQSEAHDYKINNEKGRLETTPEYWKKEKDGYDKQIMEKMEKLENMKKLKTDEKSK